MAASVGWYDTDDTTALTSIDLGAVPPGQDYFTRNGAYKEVRIKNDGDEDFANVAVEIQQASAYDAYEYLRIAPDSGGSAGAFQDYTSNPLDLGALTAGSVEPLWIDVIVPGAADAETGQRANLVTIASL